MTRRKYLRDIDVADRYGIDRSTVHRWARKGIIPRPIRLSPGCSRWIEDELDALDARRAEERTA